MDPTSITKLDIFQKNALILLSLKKKCQPDVYQISTICPIHSHSIEVFLKNYIVKSTSSPNLAKSDN